MDHSKNMFIQSYKSDMGSLEYPCRFHHGQYCFNYCIDNPCYKPLCSQCIEEHLIQHENNRQSDLTIKSLKGVRAECLMKVRKIIQQLGGKLSTVPTVQKPQQMYQEIIENIQIIQAQMHKIIDQQFQRFEQKVKVKVNQSQTTIQNLQQTYSELIKIIEELRIHENVLIEGTFNGKFSGSRIYDPNSNRDLSDSIEAIYKLDYFNILELFGERTLSYQDTLRKIKTTVNCDFNIFKNGLWDSLKYQQGQKTYSEKSAVQDSRASKVLANSLMHMLSQKENIQSTESRYKNSQKKSPNSLQFKSQISGSNITMKNIQFASAYANNYKILHFFEAGSERLHLLDVSNEKIIHKQISIPDFIVPQFHSSILCDTGSIFISGGSLQLPGATKSRFLGRYSLKASQFKKDFAKVKPRSSHSICADSEYLYITGGYGKQVDEETSFQVQFEKVNIKSGKVQKLPNSNWGGSNISVVMNNYVIKISSEGIQAFDLRGNQWMVLSKNQQNFNRACGFCKINQSQLLIYGGYDSQEIAVNACSLWTIKPKEKIVNIAELKECPLPVAEGFWNSAGIFDGESIYAIQNIEEQKGLCLDNERRLLKFNQKKGWKSVQINQRLTVTQL